MKLSREKKRKMRKSEESIQDLRNTNGEEKGRREREKDRKYI